MSGNIRTRIPILVKSLKNKIEKYYEQIEHGKYEFDSNDLPGCLKLYEFIKKEIFNFEKTFDSLTELDKKWKKIRNKLTTEDKNAEIKIYKIYTEKHDYLKILEESDSVIDELKSLNLEVKKAIQILKRNKKNNSGDQHENEYENDDDDEPNDEQNTEEELTDKEEKETGTDQTNDSEIKSDLNSYEYSNFSSNNHRIKIKLPAQSLTHFNGKYSNWTSFWDDYKSSIHNDKELENIQKFKYLRGLLHDEPYRMISPYPITNQNYPIVIELLKSRYGNENLLRENLHNELRNLRKPSESISDLRKFILSINRIILQLQTYKEDINHPQIKQSIETKLPNNIRIKVREQLGTFNTKKLMNFLDQYTQAREEVQNIEEIDKTNRTAYSNKPQFRNGNFNKNNYSKQNKNFQFNGNFQNNSLNNNHSFQTSALTTQSKQVLNTNYNKITDQKSNEIKLFCNFCEKTNHKSKDCKIYSDIETRNSRRRELKLCFNCLKKGHHVKECKSPYTCFYCKNKHNSLLCLKKKQNNNEKQIRPNQTRTNLINEEKLYETQTFSITKQFEKEEIEEILMTIEAPIININDNNELNSIILFDNGSQKSYITIELTKKLNLPIISKKTLALSTFNQTKPKIIESQIVQIGIKTLDGSYETVTLQTIDKITDLINVNLQKTIDFGRSKMPIGLRIPHILIGIDHYWQFMLSDSKIRSLPSGFFRISTKIGDICSGKGTVEITKTNYASVKQQEKEELNKTIQKFWNLESIGISDSPSLNDDDLSVIHFNKTVKFENNRYIVRWPFKQEQPEIPTNFGLCFGRLKGVLKQLIKNKKLLEYDEILQNQLEIEVNEIVPFESSYLTHYLAHHPVIKESSNTTKIRPVFDASAKLRGNRSLNDEIFQGPKKMPDLCGMILRFRLKKYVLIGDIEKAFLQIGLDILDRDTTRFLWIKNELLNELNKSNREIEMKDVEIRRFTRIPFGVNASPFLLAAVIELHLSKIDEMYENFKNINTNDIELDLEDKKEKFGKLCKELTENAYVDNFVMMCEDQNEIKFKHYWSKEIFKFASMNLREFISNHEESNNEIQKIEGSEMPKISKLLGIKWNVENDELTIPIKIPTISIGTTKRNVIHLIAKNFDPMGWISPVILPHKRFFQNLWKSKKDWDDQLSNEEIKNWNEITYEEEIHLRRFPFSNSLIQPAELHIFSDASGSAYASTAYLKLIESNEIYLIFAKTRLAPVKELTIPKLELLALLIGTRIAKFIINETKIKIQNTYLWSDSKCVLSWLKYKKELPTFVKNRVNEIKNATIVFNLKFHYIKSKENPADIASRGMTVSEIKNSDLWWYGPNWLKLPIDKWPYKQLEDFTPEEINKEFNEELEIQLTKSNLTTNPIKPFIKWEDYSSWTKLINYIKILLKFISYVCSKKSTKFQEKFKLKNALDSKNELIYKLEAEKLLIRYIQNEIEPTDEEMRQLGIYKNPGNLLVCGGRLKNASIKGIHPIFLPRNHYGTQLIITFYHNKYLHAGTLTILSEIRKVYWIPKGRKTIDQIRKKCFYCRKYNAKPFEQPIMPSFPKQRVQLSTPFSNIALDYTGPIQIKDFTEKIWILVFTCFVTRAIHLEIVTSLSTQHFLNALRRFIARRGTPKNIWSDNASQLKHTSKIINDLLKIKEIFLDETIKNYFLTENINWNFSIELAPWQNGVVERLNLNIKSALRKTIGKKLIDFETFHTMITEIESLVNSRPLTFIYDDINSYQLLRPIDFLLPHQNICIPPILEENEFGDPTYKPKFNSYEKTVELWKKTTKLLDDYWKLWTEEYIPSLRERYQIKHKNPKQCVKDFPKINDVVLIKEELPRALWKTGIIKELIIGSDNIIRGAKIEFPNKSILNRPLKLIYPLELSKDIDDNDEINEQINNLILNSRDSTHTEIQKCSFCFSNDHLQIHCTKYKGYRMRKMRAKNLSLCYKCLKPGHSIKNCKNEENFCDKCKIHKSICLNYREHYGQNSSNNDDSNNLFSKKRNNLSQTNNSTSSTLLQKLLFIALLLFLVPMNTYSNYNCPKDLKNYTTILTSFCVEEGIIVRKNLQNNEFCSDMLSCLNRHLVYDHTPYCGPKCECSKWAQQCSFVPYQSIKKYNNKKVKRLIRQAGPSICAFKQNPRCINKTKGKFHAIRLYDNSIYFVKNVHIRYAQIESKYDYLCLGEGNLTIGSPGYCELFHCDKKGTKFCYHDQRERIFLILGKTEIPIKEWGIIETEYYTEDNQKRKKHKQKESLDSLFFNSNYTESHQKAKNKQKGLMDSLFFNSNNSHNISNSYSKIKKRKQNEIVDTLFRTKRATNFLIECITGGITLNIINPVDIIGVCSQGYCITINKPNSKETIVFPQEIIKNNYDIEIKLIKNNIITETSKSNCNASPICEMIKCKMCIEYLRAPQCIQHFHFIIIISVVLFTIYILSISMQIIKFIYSILKWIYKFVFCCNKKKIKPKTKSKTRSYTLKSRTAVLLLMILNFIHLTKSCDEITNLIANSTNCPRDENGKIECTFDQTILISIKPEHKTCLKLEDKIRNTTFKTIKFSTEELILTCERESEYFMRNYEILSESVKRCPTMGQCQGSTCEKIKSDSANPEISDKANKKPGYSYCVPSCGGWHCQCFIATDGCLFYRTYMEENGNDYFEVTKCNQWPIELNFKYEIESDDGSTADSTLLKPGILNKKDNIEMTLTTMTIPPTPIFGSKFIINKVNNDAIIVNNEDLLRNSIRCPDENSAKTFSCKFPPEACKCNGGDTQVNCECTKDPLPEMFERQNEKLPIDFKGSHLFFENNQIKAKLKQTTALQLQITLKGFKTTPFYDKTKCTVESISLSGCYACKGADWKFKCKTEFGSALAQLECSNQKVEINCDTEDKQQIIQLTYNMEEINEKCSVICPGGNSEVEIKGKLLYIQQQEEQKINLNNTNQTPETSLSSDELINNIKNFASKLINNLKNFTSNIIDFLKSNLWIIWFILPLIVIFIFAFFLFPIIWPTFIKIIFRRKVKPKSKSSSVGSVGLHPKKYKIINKNKSKIK